MEPRPRVLWMQLGVRHDEAAARAEANGIKVVVNRCQIEYGRLSSEISWMGVNSRTLSSNRAQPGRGVQRLSLNRVTMAGGTSDAASRGARTGSVAHDAAPASPPPGHEGELGSGLRRRDRRNHRPSSSPRAAFTRRGAAIRSRRSDWVMSCGSPVGPLPGKAERARCRRGTWLEHVSWLR